MQNLNQSFTFFALLAFAHPGPHKHFPRNALSPPDLLAIYTVYLHMARHSLRKPPVLFVGKYTPIQLPRHTPHSSSNPTHSPINATK